MGRTGCLNSPPAAIPVWMPVGCTRQSGTRRHCHKWHCGTLSTTPPVTQSDLLTLTPEVCGEWQGWTCFLNLNVMSSLLSCAFSEGLNSKNFDNQLPFSFILMSQNSVMHILPGSNSDLWHQRQLFSILWFLGRRFVMWNLTWLSYLTYWWFLSYFNWKRLLFP